MNDKINSNAIVFSHNDLDGAGCVIICKRFFNTCAYKICNYNNIDNKIQDFILDEKNKFKKSYDYLFITDISIQNEDTIKILNNSPYKDCWFMIDHHKTSEKLHNGKNMFVITEDEEGIMNSGTNLTLEFLEYMFDINLDEQGFDYMLVEFVNYVRYYDTWLWKKFDIQTSFNLNLLFQELGYFDFVNSRLKLFNDGYFGIFDNSDLEKIKKKRDLLDNYYLNTKFSPTFTDRNDNTYSICIIEDNLNYVVDRFLDEHIGIDYVISLNLRKGQGSIRTQRDNLDVSNIALERFNGGGHPQASGFTINEELLNIIFNNLHDITK